MAILKNKARSKQFTVVAQGILTDSNLTLKERGLLVTLLSLPEGWEFTLKGMASILPENKDTIGKIVNSLEKKGYVKISQSMPGGKFGNNEMFVFDEPNLVDEYIKANSSKDKGAASTNKPKLKSPSPRNSAPENAVPSDVAPSDTEPMCMTQFNLIKYKNQKIYNTTTQAAASEELWAIFDGLNLSDEDILAVINAADGDEIKCKEAVTILRNYRSPINSVTGFLIAAVQNQYRNCAKTPQRKHRLPSNYDFDEMNRSIMED